MIEIIQKAIILEVFKLKCNSLIAASQILTNFLQFTLCLKLTEYFWC